jgi:hypothetical protein
MKRSILFVLSVLCLSIGVSAQIPAGADSGAWTALRDTRQTRYYFAENFAGFTANLTINDDGQISQALLTYDVRDGAELRFLHAGDESNQPWALQMVLNMLGHRRSPNFEKGDGRYPIAFAANDYSPAGRRVLLNDPMGSSYRILNGRVSEVARTAGNERFTISIMEEMPASNGRYLPRHFTVTYFDAKTGAIKRTEAFTDEYREMGGVWLPSSRRLIKAENGKVTTRVIQFSNARVRSQDQ